MEREGNSKDARIRFGLLLCLSWLVGYLFLLPGLSHAKTAAEILKAYEGLSGKGLELF